VHQRSLLWLLVFPPERACRLLQLVTAGQGLIPYVESQSLTYCGCLFVVMHGLLEGWLCCKEAAHPRAVTDSTVPLAY